MSDRDFRHARGVPVAAQVLSPCET
jgi:hypothetical protein